VYWNCYILDKTLAEETGRPFILPYRRSTTPLPSTFEIDELETWPPPAQSAAGIPESVAHITPHRGFVMSCFVWTCRLAMVVEDILDLEGDGPGLKGDTPWDRRFSAQVESRKDIVGTAEALSQQLEDWKRELPVNLDVEIGSSRSPMPHFVVSIAVSRVLLGENRV
jgi:hypothetical protein